MTFAFSKPAWRRIFAGIFLAVPLLAAVPFYAAPDSQDDGDVVIRRVEAPGTLWLVNFNALGHEERVVLASLQGQLARLGGDNLWLDDEDANSGTSRWLSLLRRQPGVETARLGSFAEALRRFQAKVPGYVLYRGTEPESLAVASVLAHVTAAIVVEERLEKIVRDAGFVKRDDARGGLLADLDPAALIKRTHPRLVIEQRAGMDYQLRDYALFSGALIFPANNTGAAQKVMGKYPAGSLALGWGDAAKGEEVFIGRNSALGIAMVPADHVRNLSLISALPATGPLRQKTAPSVAAPATQEHLVTFVFTDGDNLSWILNDFSSNARWFGSPQRGQVPLGWGMAPLAADIAPGVLQWYYQQAAGGTAGRDVFVAGPSGNGYFYPSKFPPGALERHCRELNRLMQKADLRLVQILDFDALDRADLWASYLRQPAIDALLYCDYAPYDKGKGRVVWAAGKPVISARAMLWKGIPGSDPGTVLRMLQAAPRTPGAVDGYSYIAVHAWSHSVEEVAALIKQLPPGVRAVAPDEFVRRFREKVKPVR